MTNSQIALIELMLKSNVLCFGRFVTKSGRESPYFINTGNYRTGEQISALGRLYAEKIVNSIGNNFDGVFGPAYKGIPLAVTTVISMARDYSIDKYYCFNRKEEKDHGEGGSIVGQVPSAGDRIIIVEDVTTAGKSIHETMEIFKKFDSVKVTDLFISINRQEIGLNGLLAQDEIQNKYGIMTHSIISIMETVNYIFHNEINGKRYIDEEMMKKIDEYQKKYCLSK